jgi:hypothetical protein
LRSPPSMLNGPNSVDEAFRLIGQVVWRNSVGRI